MNQRVAYTYAGVTGRRFIEAVNRANVGKAAERVASALVALLSLYSRVSDRTTLSQIAKFAYPDSLDGHDGVNQLTFRNATRQTSRGLANLRKADLIDYQHATGTSPNAWVSIARHAPPDMDPDPPHATSGDRPGPLGTPSRAHSGDTPRHPSEKAEEISRAMKRPPVPEWMPASTTPADQRLNLRGVSEARRALQRGPNTGVLPDQAKPGHSS